MTYTETFWSFAFPLWLICYITTFIPATIKEAITTRRYHVLTSFSSFQDLWFARFWKVFGPQSREHATPTVAPLVAQAYGVVLDIGPGSGEWVFLFDKSKVTKIYGVEPNRDHHTSLAEKIRQAGLENVYVICPVGVKELGEGKGTKWEIGKGSVDCVVTIQCLCSIPRPRDMMRELYGYLKEGGKWIVFEHVVVYPHQGQFMAWYQATVDLVWPHFVGGCEITRQTGKWLKECGDWSKVDLKQPEEEVAITYQALPHMMGILTK